VQWGDFNVDYKHFVFSYVFVLLSGLIIRSPKSILQQMFLPACSCDSSLPLLRHPWLLPLLPYLSRTPPGSPSLSPSLSLLPPPSSPTPLNTE